MSENAALGAKRPIRRALVSVYDKTGLEELARGLHAAGVQLVSTGSTAKRIADAGVPVTPVEELTGFPECLDGRVKTLHPRVHAGILADQRLAAHREQLGELGVEPFELVVVNLYPFADTVASGASDDACVEQIDIGGPSMVRAAAKNHPSVAVVVNPDRYGEVLAAAEEGGFDLAARKRLAGEAFQHTAAYDVAVAGWFSGYADAAESADAGSGAATGTAGGGGRENDPFPSFHGVTHQRKNVLRYGENPHQPAALYTSGDGGLAEAEQLHGKEMSYNNYVDTDAARRAAYDHTDPCVAVIKHTTPPLRHRGGRGRRRGAPQGARLRPAVRVRRRDRREPAGVAGAGRAGRGDLHRGRRRPRLRGRGTGGALPQEEHPRAALPGGAGRAGRVPSRRRRRPRAGQGRLPGAG